MHTGILATALWAKGNQGKLGRGTCLPTKYASRMTSVAEMTMALRAAHFQLQYLEGFLRLKAGREKVLRGRGRGGGEYTVLEVRGYPGDVVQKSGEVPPGLKRKCLWTERSQRASGSPLPRDPGQPAGQRQWKKHAEEPEERESAQRRQRGRKKESHVPEHRAGHMNTFPRNTDGTALPRGKPPRPRHKVSPTPQEAGCWDPFPGKGWGWKC